MDQDFTLCTLVSVRDYGRPVRKSPSLLKLVWVGKIHGVGVYATHSVRIWWLRNKFSSFQLKEVTKKVAPGKINHKNAKKKLTNCPT